MDQITDRELILLNTVTKWLKLTRFNLLDLLEVGLPLHETTGTLTGLVWRGIVQIDNKNGDFIIVREAN